MRTSETFIPKRKIKQEYLAASKGSCDRLVPPGGKLFSTPPCSVSCFLFHVPISQRQDKGATTSLTPKKQKGLGSSSNYSDLEIILRVEASQQLLSYCIAEPDCVESRVQEEHVAQYYHYIIISAHYWAGLQITRKLKVRGNTSPYRNIRVIVT